MAEAADLPAASATSSRSPLPAEGREAVTTARAGRRWNLTLTIGIAMLVATVLVSAALPLLTAYSPFEMADASLSPPSLTHVLGTDELGRDNFARVLYAARVSLTISGLTMVIALVAGTVLGVASGFWSGLVDTVLMRLLDILQAFPPLLLAIAFVAVLGPNLTNLVLTMGILFMPRFARVARASTLSVRERDYVAAAVVLGVSEFRTIVRHILPNITTPLIVEVSLTMTLALLTEAALSFLGLGVQPPYPTWGGMVAASTSVMTLAPWLTLAPGFAIMFVVLALLLVGDGLRDVLDPKL